MDEFELGQDELRREKYNREWQAFPGSAPPESWGDPSRGMTLRDWFAGQALMGMGTWVPFQTMPDQDLRSDQTLRARAEWAYRQADAMMAKRITP